MSDAPVPHERVAQALAEMGFAAEEHQFIRLDGLEADPALGDILTVDGHTVFYRLRSPLYEGDRAALFYSFDLIA